MNNYLTGNDIRNIGIIISAILSVGLTIIYYKISVKITVKRIEKAIVKDDEIVARKLIAKFKYKYHKNKSFETIYSRYISKFF